MHARAHAGIGLKVQHLLTNPVGVGCVGDEFQTVRLTLTDAGWDIAHNVTHMVHDMVIAHAGRVARLNEFHLNLAEIHEGVAATAPRRASSQEVSLEVVHVPLDGFF
jgi:hypothetical protein